MNDAPSSLPLRSSVSKPSSHIHPTLDDLVRLQFETRGFTLLPRQPVHSLLSGRHASRLRGRGLTFEELRGYDPAGIRLPARGLMEATDGRQRVAIPEGSHFAQAFETEFRKRCEQLRQRLHALRIPILPICTHDPVPDQVLAALSGRPGA